jgi:hypothetical protein
MRRCVMTVTQKFWAKLASAVIGAVLAGIGQFYTDPASTPEWASLTLVIGGSLLSLLGTVFLGLDGAKKMKWIDKDNDGVIDEDEIIEEKESGRACVSFLCLCTVIALLVVGASGCSVFQLHEYDPMTTEQIQKTIDYEISDYNMVSEVYRVLDVPDGWLMSLEVRHESELARLRAWLVAEEAKKIEETK